jgi:hypothetical protein
MQYRLETEQIENYFPISRPQPHLQKRKKETYTEYRINANKSETDKKNIKSSSIHENTQLMNQALITILTERKVFVLSNLID